ncbi:MAG: hypothetical protein ACP5SD_01245 [Elusimicrobiales bacterium]
MKIINSILILALFNQTIYADYKDSYNRANLEIFNIDFYKNLYLSKKTENDFSKFNIKKVDFDYEKHNILFADNYCKYETDVSGNRVLVCYPSYSSSHYGSTGGITPEEQMKFFSTCLLPPFIAIFLKTNWAIFYIDTAYLFFCSIIYKTR